MDTRTPNEVGLDARWRQRFQELVEHKKTNGHIKLVSQRNGSKEQLASWASSQRKGLRRGTLSVERRAQLDSIGFDWMPLRAPPEPETTWMQSLHQLAEYKETYGDTLVSRSIGAGHIKLGCWVRKQRAHSRTGKLSAERKAKLDSIGFDWGKEVRSNQFIWDQRFKQLVEHREIHGDFNVVRPQGASLSAWVKAQRKMKLAGTLCVKRKAELDSVGFNWEKKSRVKEWDQRFEELREYLQIRGDCDVPDSYSCNPQLADWVVNQRFLYQQKLSGEKTSFTALHEAKLDAVGFIWSKDQSALDHVYADRVRSEIQECPVVSPDKVRSDA